MVNWTFCKKDDSPNYLKLTPELTPQAYAEHRAEVKAKWERRANITGLVVLGFVLGVVFMLILAYAYAPPMPPLEAIDLTVF